MLRRVLLISVFAVLAHSAYAATIVPHRAIYDLEMKRMSQGANLGNVAGRMAYEVTGSACDGWSVNFRLVNEYVYKDGPSRLTDMQSTSWETGDGKEMKYNEKEFVDSKPASEKRLVVSRADKNGEGKGRITLPKEVNFKLDAETVFPMQHQLRLMDEAAKGSTRDVSLIYDGSTDDKPVRAITAIGKRFEAGSYNDDTANPVAAELKKFPSWPVSIGYYSTEDSNAETPVYQINFQMYENGVSTDLVMDYGTFALVGKLSHLEILKPDVCE